MLKSLLSIIFPQFFLSSFSYLCLLNTLAIRGYYAQPRHITLKFMGFELTYHLVPCTFKHQLLSIFTYHFFLCKSTYVSILCTVTYFLVYHLNSCTLKHHLLPSIFTHQYFLCSFTYRSILCTLSIASFCARSPVIYFPARSPTISLYFRLRSPKAKSATNAQV